MFCGYAAFMPELPDVEGFRRVLAENAKGRRVASVVVHDAGVLRGVTPRKLDGALRGRRMEEPDRHGKWLIAPAEGPVLLMHFGMTGSLSWHPPDAPHERFDRVDFRFPDGELRFGDMRKLQGVHLAADGDAVAAVLDDLGPDAMRVGRRELAELLARRRGRLKSVLTDQAAIAGLGNLLVDEITWQARVSPFRAAAGLSDAERGRLHRAMRRVLDDSVDAGRVPTGSGWLTGVRDEDGAPCPRCRTTLSRRRLSGRTTVWCTHCQPE
jgi:formamidopyrimidine-DNA glycosylase